MKISVPPPHVRLQNLEKLDDEALADSLLNDENEIVRHESAFLISHRATNRAFQALCYAAGDNSLLVRHEVALALAKFPCEQSISVLFGLLLDGNISVSNSARYAILEIALKEAA